MYTELLKLTYKEAKEKFEDLKDNSSIRKVITLNNRSDIDSYSDDSEILIYYDVITGEPLTLIERLDKDLVQKESVEEAVSDFNSQSKNYVASIVESDEFIDITVVHETLAICPEA